MRPEVLNRGYGPATKLLFGLIRLVSRHPVPDAAKLVFYGLISTAPGRRNSPMRRCAGRRPGR